MDLQKRKLAAGVVGLAAAALFVGMLFFLGLTERFAPHGKFRSTFLESVQGLTVGSPVKYRGAPIGSVSEIIIHTADKSIEVKMDISLNAFPNFASGRGGAALERLYDFFSSEIDNGLRCRLEYTSMATGMRYIELDYYGTPGSYSVPKKPGAGSDGSLYIPSTPSTMKNILASVTTSLERISRIRFEEISDGIIQNLKQLTAILGDPSIRQTIEHVEQVAAKLDRSMESFNSVITEDKLRELLTALERDMAAVEKFVATAEKELSEAKAGETAADVRKALAGTTAGVSETRSELSNTLFKLNRTLDNLDELIELLRDDPSSIVGGKRRPPADPANR